MTVKTRRRLVICVVALAVTLPAESILLQALATSDEKEVARTWVQSLPPDQVRGAASAIEAFPFAYRREIMRALSPAERAKVWRDHIASYITSHPDLDISVVALLSNAASLATPDEFAAPSDEGRQQIGIIAEQTKILLGTEDTLDLFYRLGPKEVGFASAVPVTQQLANFIRGRFVVQANADDCDCSTSFGCDGGGAAHCQGGVSCNRDETWPMCGWLWNQVCDGLCSAGADG